LGVKRCKGFVKGYFTSFYTRNSARHRAAYTFVAFFHQSNNEMRIHILVFCSLFSRPALHNFLVATTLFASCNGQYQESVESKLDKTANILVGDTVTKIDGEIRDIFQDSKNNIWFASNGEGVFKYNGKTITQFTEKNGLVSNYVWMVEEGKDGNIWFKTNIRPQDVDAICYFDGYKFKTISPGMNILDYNFQDGDLLFDYYYDGKSLSKIQLPHTSTIMNEDNIRHHYDIFCTLKDRNGNVWFGTCTAGICKYDGTTYTWFDNKELGAAVRSLFEDSDGTIWAGNNGDGLFKYDGKDFVSFSREKNLHNPDFEKYPIGKPGLLSRVWTIADDRQGNLWIGTIDNGVWMYDGKTITNYTTKNGLAIDAIWKIYTDKQGRLWFGTEGAGVYVFDGKKFKQFSS
jgi:Two component regulator propeller